MDCGRRRTGAAKINGQIEYICVKSFIMSTVELRHVISEQLLQIEDESFLSALKTIIDSKISNGIYKLSEYEKERVYLGRERMKNGETISNEDVQKEIEQWLSEK